MRPDKAFVGSALVEFFGGLSVVSVLEGEDPPDLCLRFCDSRIGVEVTRLSQFTFEPNGALNNRITQDSFGMQLLENIDSKIGSFLPNNISLLVSIEVPVFNASRFKEKLMTWVAKIAVTPVSGAIHEQEIEGSKVSISVVPIRTAGKKITGFVVNKHSSADILLNARLVLEDRICTKSDICKSLSKPIWLALLNDYWLADADTYALAAQQTTLDHCFERIFLVFDNAFVTELSIATSN